MASTPVEPDLGPHTGGRHSTSTFIVALHHDPDGTGEPPDPPAGRRFPVVGLLIIVALAAIVALVSVTFSRFLEPPSRDVRSTGAPAAPPVPPSTVTGPLGATRTAEFHLVADVTAVTVTAADLGDDLYRASTPAGSGFVPRVAQEGDRVTLRVVNVAGVADKGSPDTVTMELNQRVTWRIALTGGAESATVDLRSGTLAGIDLTGGVARVDLWLPRPRGEVAVTMSGGARDVAVHAPSGVPVRIVLARGAASVTVDGARRTGVVAGTRIVPTGWDAARDRYAVDAVTGLASLTVGR